MTRTTRNTTTTKHAIKIQTTIQTIVQQIQQIQLKHAKIQNITNNTRTT